jgi:hypothetical protein
MRTIQYQRHEFHHEPEGREAPLSVLVYDIPYFGACGFFPPFHIINQYFASGGSQGSMGPGATWEPFEISQKEYQDLVATIVDLDPILLGDAARYTEVKFVFDHSFGYIQDRFEWVQAISAKHRKGNYKPGTEA